MLREMVEMRESKGKRQGEEETGRKEKQLAVH